jgi:predicted transcriptional regulator
MTEDDDTPHFMAMTADIVSAYVTRNHVSGAELPNLISAVHRALSGTVSPVEEPKTLSPAVPIRRSVTPDAIICLEDGRSFKSLRRHLATRYGMTPEDYRAKWGLPKDYPMVAPNYAKQRSDLAKSLGLGQGGRSAAKTTAAKTATKTARRNSAGKGA